MMVFLMSTYSGAAYLTRASDNVSPFVSDASALECQQSLKSKHLMECRSASTARFTDPAQQAAACIISGARGLHVRFRSRASLGNRMEVSPSDSVMVGLLR